MMQTKKLWLLVALALVTVLLGLAVGVILATKGSEDGESQSNKDEAPILDFCW
jgi:flagellar basal body-associated protein FliL